MRIGALVRGEVRIESAVARYAFALVAVLIAFVLRMGLVPMAGRGAPFVVYFTALLATSLYAGPGPAMLSLAVSLPLAVGSMPPTHDRTALRLAYQTLLYLANGMIIFYLALLADRRRLRILRTVELSPDGYIEAEISARVTGVNDVMCQLLGYSREELVGRLSVFDLVTPDEIPRLEAMRAELLDRTTAHKAEWSIRRKDGSVFPVEVSSNILPDGRWQAFVRDVTERRELAKERDERLMHAQIARQRLEATNERLHESEERFRLAFEDAPIGMALVALDGGFVRVNRVLCEITGFSVDELLTLNGQAITHPNDRDEDVELARQLVAGEIPRFQREKRYIRKDRTIVDVMVSGSVLRAVDDTPRYFITQVEDIWERKRAIEALSLSEAKFSGIVSIAADAIISVDEQQHILLFNDGAEKIFRCRREDMLGKPLDLLVPERFRAAHRARFARFVAGGEVARPMADRQEIFGLRQDGEEFPAEASISKVAVGGTTFFSVVMHDISYRKSVEAALQRAVTARDDVLGIVAHDLRNPLSTIIASTALLERPGPEPERRDETVRHVITRSAHRMNALIQDLLDVAMVEAGQLKVDCARLSAADLLREAVDTQASLVESSGLVLQLDVAADVPVIWGDRNRLLRVLENLVGNAIKFTKEGGRITVGAAQRAGEVVFSIADTGSGIPVDNLPHVFDHFWQAAGRTKRLGAGLGLPIAKGIVEAHGGQIWVESTVGHGSTFLFAIPLAQGESVAPGRSAPAPHPERPSGVAA
jgi:PAS domain S-box-containing protein